MKTPLFVISTLLFFLTLSTTCEKESPIVKEPVPATLLGLELTHLDNSNQQPTAVINNRVNRQAYMLCINLLIETEPYKNGEIFYIPTLTDPIRSMDIYVSSVISEEEGNRSDISDQFKDYPLPLEDKLRDPTTYGGLLTECIYTHLYKALTTPLSAGEYIFHVVCTLESGAIIEESSASIKLY